MRLWNRVRQNPVAHWCLLFVVLATTIDTYNNANPHSRYALLMSIAEDQRLTIDAYWSTTLPRHPVQVRKGKDLPFTQLDRVRFRGHHGGRGSASALGVFEARRFERHRQLSILTMVDMATMLPP